MSYLGGKGASGVSEIIICQMPPHDCYVEPFLGHSAVWRKKLPAREQHGYDLNSDAIAWWQRRELRSEFAEQFHHADGFSVFARKDWPASTVFYLDPPYPHETRSSRHRYKHELSDLQHAALISNLEKWPYPTLVSSYWSELYAHKLKSWRLIQFPAMTRGGVVRLESLWMNYPAPSALHDYRFLGEGFRERERIKRKAKRFVRRLDRLPELERKAILSAASHIIARDLPLYKQHHERPDSNGHESVKHDERSSSRPAGLSLGLNVPVLGLDRRGAKGTEPEAPRAMEEIWE